MIVGAGIAGIATAYYLCVESKMKSVLLIDCRQAMSYTSAQSGDNYRNWWPHWTMTDFANDSIDELDRLAADSDNIINMSRGGYVLVTRQKVWQMSSTRFPVISMSMSTITSERFRTHFQRSLRQQKTSFTFVGRGT